MKYQFKSFSIPPASLPKGVNMHGQSWEEIFGVARRAETDQAPQSGGPTNQALQGVSNTRLDGQLPKETD